MTKEQKEGNSEAFFHIGAPPSRKAKAEKT